MPAVVAGETLSGVPMLSLKFALLCAFAVAAMAAAASPAVAANPVVVMDTNQGTIEIELYADKSPVTVKNFLAYVADKHYDGTIFHRVISNFMIQGGGFEPGMKQKKVKAAIKNESGNGVSNARGAIAMARTSDLDSATSQFFINTVDNERLDEAKYCAFGKVVKGLDVVDKIRKVKTGNAEGFQNVPTEDVVIKSVTVKK